MRKLNLLVIDILLILFLASCTDANVPIEIEGTASEVSYRSDGKMLAAVLHDSIVLYSLPNVKLYHKFEHLQQPKHAWSLDNQSIAIWGNTTKVQIWRLSDLFLEQEVSSALGISQIAFTDAKTGLLIGFDTSGNTFIWNIGQENQAKKLETSKSKLTIFSPDLKLLAIGGYDNSITILEVATTKILTKIIPSRPLRLKNMEFSTDSKIIAASYFNDDVLLWQVDTGELLHTFSNLKGLLQSLAFSPDDHFLATGEDGLNQDLFGDDTSADILIWRVSDGVLVKTLSGHQNDILSLAFNPDGKTLASVSSDKTLRLWDVSDLK